MKNNRKTVIAIIVLAVVIIGAYFIYNNLAAKYDSTQQDDETIQNSKIKAPNFVVYDANGKEIKLSDFYGRPVVVNFWASWCPSCKKEMPYFNDSYNNFSDCVAFLMVDLIDGSRETQESGQSYVDSRGYDFKIYFDRELKASNLFEIKYIPTTVFINAEGYIVKTHTGMLDDKTLRKYINLIYKGKCLY